MKQNQKNLNLSKGLKNKVILITGGAGSIGSHLTKKLLEYPIESIRALDIDEHALFQLKRDVNDPRIRLLLGSVLDKERLEMAMSGVDIIIHTAAIKNIEISEFNPIETIDTNVNGLSNIIKITEKLKISKMLNISTDKAAEPSTLYGVTKQLSEKLVHWAGNHVKPTKFASVRLGNVYETRGNVFEVWEKELSKNSPLSITHTSVSRYIFHIDEATEFILKCLPLMKHGEIFIPKMELYNIKELANNISKNHKIIGLRKGEKLTEVLITETEKTTAIEKNNMWIIN